MKLWLMLGWWSRIWENKMDEKEILLQLKNIKVNYGGVKALAGVDIEIDEGEIIALIGPNGAGKSTVLKAIFGLTNFQSGQVYWRGKKISPVSYQMVKRGASFVPQGRRVFSDLTIKENLEMGGFAVGDKIIIKQRIGSILELFPDLKKKLKKKARTLSGGQQQMLALARGLMTDPKVLLLDEPSLGLSPKIVKEVFAKIKEINLQRKTAVVIVEHNIKSLFEIAQRVYLLDKGEIVEKGSPQKFSDGQIIKRIFTGR